MPTFPLGEWLPDRSPFELDGLVTATNVVATANGYTSMPQLQTVQTLSALPNGVVGCHRGRTQSGLEYQAAACAESGTETTTLHVVGDTSDWVDYSQAGDYTTDPNSDWSFCLYGDDLICTSKGLAPQYKDVGTSNDFADLSSHASRAAVVATFKEFTVLGNIIGQNNNSAIGTQEAGLHWSGIGDPTSWPTVGSDDAVDVESDFQILEGDGGPITDIIPGSDFATIFRKHQIWRMDYVSGSAVFRFRKADDRRGSVFSGAAIAVGGLVYFAAEEGFFAFDGNLVSSIGSERVDRTWKDMVDFGNNRSASVAHDANLRTIFWTVPTGSGNSSILFGYNYALSRWTRIDTTIEHLTSTYGELGGGGNLDDAPYGWLKMDNYNPSPADYAVFTTYNVGDRVRSTVTGWTQYEYIVKIGGVAGFGQPGPSGYGTYVQDNGSFTITWEFNGEIGDNTLQLANLDTLGSTNPTDETMAAFNVDHRMGTFDSASGYSGVIETGDYEMPDGVRNFLRWVRPNNTSGMIDVSVATRLQPTDTVSYSTGRFKSDVGVTAFRITGRYMRAKFSLDSNVANFIGFDAEVNPLGARR